MKYTILGFSQQRAVELCLSVEDLAILRWFVDFYSTDHMRKFQADGKEFVLVSYQHFLEDMPIFTCTKKTLAAKFKHLVDSGVLEYSLIKDCGTFSVYRIGRAYEGLICRPETDGKNSTPLPKNEQPRYPKIGNPVTEKSVTKDPSTIYPSTSNQEDKESREKVPDEPAHRSPNFKPPTVEEVRGYCKERRNQVDPQRFVDFYAAKGWMVGKNKMRDWQAAVRTWEFRDKEEKAAQPEDIWGGIPKL